MYNVVSHPPTPWKYFMFLSRCGFSMYTVQELNAKGKFYNFTHVMEVN